MHFGQRPVIETASCPPDKDQIAVPVETQQQRAEIFSGAFRRRKSADDKMIGLLRLDLQPVFGASLLVLACLMFGDDTFEAALPDGLKKFDTAAFNMIREANPSVIAGNQFVQHRLSLFEGKFHHVVSVKVEKIECVEVNRDLPVGLGDVLCSRQVDSRLNQPEMSLALL